MNDYGENERFPEGDENREIWFDNAQRRVRTPGLLLMLFGALTIALSVAYGGFCAMNAEGWVIMQYDWIEKQQAQQPPEQRQKLPPKEEAIESTKVQGPIYGLIGAVLGVFSFLGGTKMRSLSGYGLSVAGAVTSILPGFCCCCVGMIPGIWSLVVLMNSDVKLAFAKVSSGQKSL